MSVPVVSECALQKPIKSVYCCSLSKRNPIAQSVANDSRQGLECQALRVGTSVDLQQSKVGQSGIQLTANETHVVLQERDA